jgi:hypothetical protein
MKDGLITLAIYAGHPVTIENCKLLNWNCMLSPSDRAATGIEKGGLKALHFLELPTCQLIVLPSKNSAPPFPLS